MKRYMNLKTVLTSVLLLLGTINQVKAQSNEKFEGEITFETYENYSDIFKKMPNSIYFDGVHKQRMILKGNRMHLIDETTKCHIIADNATLQTVLNGGKSNEYGYVHYCDLTKTGLNSTKMISDVAFLRKQDKSGGSISEYTFDKTDKVETIADVTCSLYQGNIKHSYGGMDLNVMLHAYLSDIVAPEGYTWSLWGLQLPNIAMKWIMKYDGGHVSALGTGEISFYMEADVINVQPRKVSDDEFEIPSDYKIVKAGNPFSMMKYYKNIKSELEKAGIKGGDNSQKSTGVHYKTDGEWDF